MVAINEDLAELPSGRRQPTEGLDEQVFDLQAARHGRTTLRGGIYTIKAAS